MRVLVTGAAGYIGRAVLVALRHAGHEPVVLLHHDHGMNALDVETHIGDLLVPESLSVPLSRVDAVVHLAALTRVRESWHEPAQFFRINASGTANLLAEMMAHDVRALVFASTGAIYGSPELQPMGEDLPDAIPHPYAASKRAAELAIEWQARARQIGAAIMRVFNVAGGQDPEPTRVVPRVVAAAAGEAPFEVNGDGSAVRDLVHVEDAARAFTAALDRLPPIGESRRFNIGSGSGTSVMDVVAAAQRVTGSSLPLAYRVPADEPARLVADVSRAKLELDWTPQRSTLEDILADAWQWRDNHD